MCNTYIASPKTLTLYITFIGSRDGNLISLEDNKVPRCHLKKEDLYWLIVSVLDAMKEHGGSVQDVTEMW